MGSLVYLRLIGYTAGTLLQLFWMVVILGYRRQRNFERVFFFLCLALFFFYGGSLLALNAQIHYVTPPALLQSFVVTLLCAGLSLLPPLLIHLHLEFAETRGMLRSRPLKRVVLSVAYAPVLYFALRVYPQLATTAGFNFLIPGNALGRGYGIWLGLAMLISAWWEMRFTLRAPDQPQRMFHSYLAAIFVAGAAMILYLHDFGGPLPPSLAAGITVTLALVAIVPSALLIYLELRYKFLQIGRQTNLVYAVTATFLALLYLSLVRRVSVWLEPVLPPEASASILLFLLVIFIEPLQRFLGRSLRKTVLREMDRVQRVTAEIQHEARQGSLAGLVQFIGRRIREEFELSEAHLALANRAGNGEGHTYSDFSGNIGFPIGQADRALGVLEVKPHGAGLSGETRAALEFLCEQLPGALDLCRLIEEKLHLERELAERERLALVGQMAASISHNLKNPLGSIKTILQVQMESAELPESMRGETKMVLDEIGRLATKLNQLLQFSRPAVRAESVAANCDAKAVVEEVASVLRHEAEWRGIVLGTEFPDGSLKVAASAEAMSDIASNLLVNALEAAPRGGHVSVRMTEDNGGCALVVQDDGPGIPASAKEKVLQPFFTTKSQGTGLGLAIVARRVAESGGRLEWDSPVKDGHGTRFRVTLLRAGERELNAGNEGQETK
ncbi:MAG TPA: ATP-binding protein [Candidatus Acidoferrum sp.]|nr:ATP-binding protein [Candidatus Acidoferrum sp.]